MRKLVLIVVLASSGLIGACGAEESTIPIAASTQPRPMPGSDSDAHGCKASAGYRWCARTKQCERPWELAKVHGFSNTVDGFKAFCDAPPTTTSNP